MASESRENLWWVTKVSIAIVFFEQMINGETTFDRSVNLCIATVKYNCMILDVFMVADRTIECKSCLFIDYCRPQLPCLLFTDFPGFPTSCHNGICKIPEQHQFVVWIQTMCMRHVSFYNTHTAFPLSGM